MVEVQAIAFGSAIGIVGSVPAAFLFEQALKGTRQVSVGAGLASIMASFVMMSVAVLVVRIAAPHDVLLFGVAEVASFLLLWAIEAGRAWRDAQRGARPGERKRGEPTR
ncbi:MAG: hypothetical protein J6S63_05190 [Atopobiaceae bacterium]|nr:hypothetical protein [Atopobiaceae bacterium]